MYQAMCRKCHQEAEKKEGKIEEKTVEENHWIYEILCFLNENYIIKKLVKKLLW